MVEIIKITRAETSLVEPRQLLTENDKLIGVLSMTMIQSPKTDKLSAGQEIEFESRIYEVYRISGTPRSTDDVINLALLYKRNIV